ncbi:MAG: peptide-methionine (S)-S-oxide reductase MsrA [Limnochordia bacterium]|jgi:peptide-methionine (S)-S-oxide reductase
MESGQRLGARETATFGGGCFWCLEAVFDDLRGVEKVVSGYSGGSVANPSYEQVCTGETGHAEVVQVTFDPSQISFGDLLVVFFTIHDPTTPNRQGGDVGPQYRSVIFCHSSEQERTARAVIQALNKEGIWEAPIVTEVIPYERFYSAEDGHSDFFSRNPLQPYCQAVVAPKVRQFRRQFLSKLKR